MENRTAKEKYISPKIEKLTFEPEDVILASGGGDVGRGRGQGGGCDGVPYHSNERSFSNGNNSGC